MYQIRPEFDGRGNNSAATLFICIYQSTGRVSLTTKMYLLKDNFGSWSTVSSTDAVIDLEHLIYRQFGQFVGSQDSLRSTRYFVSHES